MPAMIDLRQVLEAYQELGRQLGDADAEAAAADAPTKLRVLLRELRTQPPSFEARRLGMVEAIARHWAKSGARIPAPARDRVLDALSLVPRECFVAPEIADLAYLPTALAIGHDQSISHPLAVACLALAAEIPREGRVLDVGTGCGYQAAILSKLARSVVSIEIRPELAEGARRRLRGLRIRNVDVRIGDGCMGAADAGPFDAIVVAAASAAPPPRLIEQLAPGGRLVLPLGGPDAAQQLVVVTTHDEARRCCSLGPARFVPLLGGSHDIQPDAAVSMQHCYGAAITGVPD